MTTIKTKSGEIVLGGNSVISAVKIGNLFMVEEPDNCYPEFYNPNGLHGDFVKTLYLRDAKTEEAVDYWRWYEEDEVESYPEFSRITEKQAAGMVEKVTGIVEHGYRDYTSDTHCCKTAKGSLRSLIESYKLNPDKTVIIKRI